MMASLLIANTLQVDFESVLRFPKEGMSAMFKALESSGLRGFLGCSSGIYEADLAAFFQNALVRENSVVSTIQGKSVEITKEPFSGTFELPTEGLSDFSEVPKNFIFNARSIFSKFGEQVQTSCKNRKMKYEFCLLNDILAKSVTVKAGSFDAVTHERFLLMTAIQCGLKINWSKLLFDILKEMVTPSSKQARGFAVQICVLLQGVPDLALCEPKPFPTLKVLNIKTVGTYVAKQKGIYDGNEGDEQVMATAAEVKKKPMTKKRTAPTTAEPVAKKKRTTVGRVAPADKNLALVTVAQEVEPISTIPAVTLRAPRRRAPKRKLALPEGSEDEIVDSIIHQVIADTAAIETGEPDLEESVIKETAEIAEKETDFMESVEMRSVEIDIEGYERSIAVNDEDDNLDGAENEISRKMTSFTAPKQFLKEPLRSGEDDDMSGFKQPSKLIETAKEIETVATEDLSLAKIVAMMTDSEDTEPLSKVLELTDKSKSDEESMSIEDILKQILEEMLLPSVTAAEITRIKFGLGIEIPGVNEGDSYKASLPQIATSDKGKAPLVAKDEIKGHPAREMFSLIFADIDFLVQLREKVIADVVSFFHSFSLSRLAVLVRSKILLPRKNIWPRQILLRQLFRGECT
ncbi:splicing factor 3B subunit 1-like [Dorcoceras hygrometricum]|uniref:Splicing factor 3B subunit 1-like n=1 Tax=Dorcoceras hygrometricum TaxID=472368 RepID=A0A2Z7ALW3_9LAMI|nr:splicing factor 3B subunit 1-like [Dorcoceras hygrometricum]